MDRHVAHLITDTKLQHFLSETIKRQIGSALLTKYDVKLYSEAAVYSPASEADLMWK